MKIQGRYIHHGPLPSGQGLAIDETLARSVSQGESVPVLHLYSYIPSVILGRYQNASASLRLDRCEALGIEVNRRATGGGTVFMTRDQVAFGLFLPDDFPGLPRTIQGAFEFLAAAFARSLRQYGLEAEFRGKNDLTVNGKKIAGLAISQDMEGVTFFHTSLLLDFDLETMLEILNLPVQKMLDRGISCFGQRMTTIRQETGKEISLAEMQQAVRRSVGEQLGLELIEEQLSEAEQKQIEKLLCEKYENEEWTYSTRSLKGRMAFAEMTTPGGLLQAHLSLSGGVIDILIITGDYFSRTRDIARLESSLKYCRADRQGLEKRLQETGAQSFIHQVDLPRIVDLIEKAVHDSKKGQGEKAIEGSRV
jgi:lipoate---protein ligase